MKAAVWKSFGSSGTRAKSGSSRAGIFRLPRRTTPTSLQAKHWSASLSLLFQPDCRNAIYATKVLLMRHYRLMVFFLDSLRTNAVLSSALWAQRPGQAYPSAQSRRVACHLRGVILLRKRIIYSFLALRIFCVYR